ncbi:MAG TPA: Fur family transcriptional regulator [Tetragenococcus sp.]|nr:Fur family transcriptional regulator [Tetragenococcus sp.]
MPKRSAIDKAMEQLKENGLKQTKKREAMITYLAKCNRYISAKKVYQYLEKEYTGISYDTIYRNLRDFSDIGILEETELEGEMRFRFSCSLEGARHHHHHFICTVCGKTKELKNCPMEFFEEQLTNCTIEGHRFEIYGRCEDCQK